MSKGRNLHVLRTLCVYEEIIGFHNNLCDTSCAHLKCLFACPVALFSCSSPQQMEKMQKTKELEHQLAEAKLEHVTCAMQQETIRFEKEQGSVSAELCWPRLERHAPSLLVVALKNARV